MELSRREIIKVLPFAVGSCFLTAPSKKTTNSENLNNNMSENLKFAPENIAYIKNFIGRDESSLREFSHKFNQAGGGIVINCTDYSKRTPNCRSFSQMPKLVGEDLENYYVQLPSSEATVIGIIKYTGVPIVVLLRVLENNWVYGTAKGKLESYSGEWNADISQPITVKKDSADRVNFRRYITVGIPSDDPSEFSVYKKNNGFGGLDTIPFSRGEIYQSLQEDDIPSGLLLPGGVGFTSTLVLPR